MKNMLQRLLDIGSAPLGTLHASDHLAFGGAGVLERELLDLLRRRNGFYAFESALHVFPASSSARGVTLERWNAHELWRYEYDDLANGKLFFAQDAFGNQFCIESEGISVFDAETGTCEPMCHSFDEWAERVLGDCNAFTGYSMLHEWQSVHGAIARDCRLVPKTPFCLGGEYVLGNLYASSAISGMKARGNLARQIRDLPDGASVVFRVID